MFTIKQDPNERIVSLNLSNYLKKPEAATKEEILELRQELDTKLSSLPSHVHSIEDIDQLTATLNTKLDNKQYSYKTILSDSELIDFIKAPTIKTLEISKGKDIPGYFFKVDEGNNLLITDSNNNTIMWYNNSVGHWILNNVDINSFVNVTNDTLLNHAEAIRQIANSL